MGDLLHVKNGEICTTVVFGQADVHLVLLDHGGRDIGDVVSSHGLGL